MSAKSLSANRIKSNRSRDSKQQNVTCFFSGSELFQVQMSYVVSICNDAVGDNMQRGIFNRLGKSSELACLYATLRCVTYFTLRFALRTYHQSKLFVV